MGLDMYLKRMPRFNDTTPKDVCAIESYLDWKEAKEQGSKFANCTLKEWCGVDYRDISMKAVAFYKRFYAMKYYNWDTEHKYGRMMISEAIAGWRKANAIHRWFVENVQDGEDDCDIYEVPKEQLEELLGICITIRDASTMEKGWVHNGDRLANGMMCPNYEEGEYIVNAEIAEELLPTQGGFFFGGTDYDQWYMDDIKYTIDVLDKVLKETDFETQMIAYRSSW